MLQVAGGKVDGDDIHLIMEYKREEKWGTVPSPRANRLDHRSTRGRRSGALYPHLELTGKIMEIQEGGAVGHFFCIRH